MSFKSITLAAAVVAITATASSANSFCELGRTIDGGDILELGLITTDGAGVVELYDFHTGSQGRLVGTRRLRAGANPNVRVRTTSGRPQRRDVIALVKVNGRVVASKKFDVE